MSRFVSLWCRVRICPCFCLPGVHFHAVFIHFTKFNRTSEEVKKWRGEAPLDLEYRGDTYYPNYQAVKYYASTIEYVCEGKQYISDIGHLVGRRICDHKEILWLEAQKVGYEKALMYYTIRNPKKALSSPKISSLKRLFKDIQKIKHTFQDYLKNISINSLCFA